MTNSIATTWDVRNSTQENLTAFADIMADALKNELVPVQDALTPLHHAALELNRRHGHASLRDFNDRPDAIDTLISISDLQAQDTGDMDLDWAAIALAEARAMGCILDNGTDDMWRALAYEGYTREGIETGLQRMAILEGKRRGFVHRAEVARRSFFPADAVAPF